MCYIHSIVPLPAARVKLSRKAWTLTASSHRRVIEEGYDKAVAHSRAPPQEK